MIFTTTGWIIILVCIGIGYMVGSYLYKRKPNILESDKKVLEVINNPHLLAEKLNANGKIFDDGNEVKIAVGVDEKTGEEIVTVEEIKSKEAKKVQDKVDKSRSPTKKKIKSKAKKKK